MVMKIFNKKAGIMDAQFGWVFAFMIGVIILSLFTAVAFQIRSSSQQRISYEILKTFRSVFTSGGTEVGRFFQLDLVNVIMDYSCVGGETSISVEGFSEEIPLVVFSQENLIGNRFYIYSTEWDVPFLSNSVVYLASENFYFYMVEPNETSSNYDSYRRAVESIPSRFPFGIIEEGEEVNVPEEADTRVIVFEDIEEEYNSNLNGFFEDNFPNSVIEVSPDLSSGSFFGNLTYYDYGDYNNPISQEHYFGTPLLVGSFLSSSENYRCFFDEMVNDLENVLDLFKRRSERLVDYYNNADDYDCFYVYNKLIEKIEDYENLINNFDYNYDSFKNWYDLYDGIFNMKNEADTKSCEVVY